MFETNNRHKIASSLQFKSTSLSKPTLTSTSAFLDMFNFGMQEIYRVFVHLTTLSSVFVKNYQTREQIGTHCNSLVCLLWLSLCNGTMLIFYTSIIEINIVTQFHINIIYNSYINVYPCDVFNGNASLLLLQLQFFEKIRVIVQYKTFQWQFLQMPEFVQSAVILSCFFNSK